MVGSMTSDARIARRQLRAAEQLANKQVLLDVIKNPVFELLVGFLAVEYAQRHGYMGNISGTVCEAGIVSAVGLQQMAPYLGDIIKGTGEGIAAVGKLAGTAIPLLGGL